MTEQNQQFDRLREQMLQESSKNLYRIAISGLEIWKGYLFFGSSVIYAWCDTLRNTHSLIEEMASSGQNQNENQNQRRAS